MKKQIIISMKQVYPFQKFEDTAKQNTQILVRKVYEKSNKKKQEFLEKLTILKNLNNENIIKIESIMEEDKQLHLFFEHVPIKLETWILNINPQLIRQFREQIIKFSQFLANNSILIIFSLQNIGMDKNYKAKYFLDLNFTVDNQLGKEKLKLKYTRQIMQLFRPYYVSSRIKTQQTQFKRTKIQNMLDGNLFKTFESNQFQKENQRKKTKVSSNAQSFDVKSSIKTANNDDKKMNRIHSINFSENSQKDFHVRQFLDVPESKNSQNPSLQKSNSGSKLNQSQFYGYSKQYNSSQTYKRYSEMNIIKNYSKNEYQTNLKIRVKTAIQKSMTAINQFKSIDWKNVSSKSVKKQK